MADVGPENPLPPLSPPGLVTNPVDLSAADPEMARNLTYGKVSSLLPYTVQDGYTRDLSDRELRTAVVENEILRAEFLLDLGGRLWSLVHKPTGRELLHRNRILQPANLGLRNAWFAGGVEWNLGTTGHTPLTCAPMHAAKISRPDGIPGLRLWEWERLRELVYQLDVWLEGPALYVHVRITNPNPHEVPVYWWSNIAVPQTEHTRVLAPAEKAWHLGHDGILRYVDVPQERPNQAADYFFDIPAGQQPWIAAVEPDGTGLFQTSTARLRGRKLFLWGESQGGKRWQEWLSPHGQSYLEIQAGLAKTQLEHLPLPGGMQWSWLEAYGMNGEVPLDTVEDKDGYADVPPTEIVHRGSGWGALERKLTALLAARASAPRLRNLDLPATPFPDDTIGRDQASWLTLLNSGEMPAPAPRLAPASFQVGKDWLLMLERAPRNWFTLLHLGVARYHWQDHAGARSAWLSSVEEQRNPWALRNLAVLARYDDSLTEAGSLLREAFSMVPHSRPLAVETLQVLAESDPAAALRFVDLLPPQLRVHGRIRMAECRAAIAIGDLDRAQHIVTPPLPEGSSFRSDPAGSFAPPSPDESRPSQALTPNTIREAGLVVDDLREGEDTLDRIWFSLSSDPLPYIYDFRMR